MKRIVSFALSLFLLAPMMFSCNNENSSYSDLMSGITNIDSTDDDGNGSASKTGADITAETETALLDFYVKLFGASITKGKNSLVSPLSVLTALAMTENGAKGDTLEQFESVFGVKKDELNVIMADFLKNLPKEDKCKLAIANSIWMRDTETLKVPDEFLKTNIKYYGASVFKAPFDSSTVKAINNWVDKNTDSLIKEIIDGISEDTMMYLINALVFDAEWENIYSEYEISNRIFNSADGKQQNVPFMYSEENAYLEDNNATGFIKYYSGRRYAFAALLPNEDISLDNYISTLDGKHIKSLLEGSKVCTVNAAMPAFEYDYSAELSAPLKSLGLTLPFDSSAADLSGLGSSSLGNLFIDQVLHKTYIKVDARGTKAGAVTAVVCKVECCPIEEPKNVILDRPFMYMIIDCETMTPVFIGTLCSVD